MKFFVCHVRHFNPVKIHPESTTKNDKKLLNDLNYDGVEFPIREKDFSKTEKFFSKIETKSKYFH